MGSPPAHDRIDESRIGEESIGRQIGQTLPPDKATMRLE